MSNIRRGRGKAPRRPVADVPTGLLDAYTESATASSMSESEKFREGYVKKKDKVKKRTAKKSETESEEIKDTEDGDEVAEAWDAEEGGVLDSWDQIAVPDQPVPQTAKQANRKAEKKRKQEHWPSPRRRTRHANHQSNRQRDRQCNPRLTAAAATGARCLNSCTGR